MTRPYALYDVVVELLFGQRYSFQKSTAIAIAIANDLMVLRSSNNDVEVIVMKEPKLDVSVAASATKIKERIKLYTIIAQFIDDKTLCIVRCRSRIVIRSKIFVSKKHSYSHSYSAHF